jgi:hypothetical protein
LGSHSNNLALIRALHDEIEFIPRTKDEGAGVKLKE